MYEQVWLDGALVPADAALVPARSPGVMQGLGAFETFRWYAGRGVFRLAAHLARLAAALDALAIPCPGDWHALPDAVRHTVVANGPAADAVVRLTVTAESDGQAPHVLIHLRDVSYPTALYDRGVDALVCTAARERAVARHKLTSYAGLAIYHAQAVSAGYDEAILVDSSGQVLEGTTTNVFIVQDGEAWTPPVSLPVLPGVTRAAVLEVAPTVGLKAREALIGIDELSAATEAFLTNSVAEILPLTRLQGRAVGDGRPGPAAVALTTAYRDRVCTELAPIA